MTDWISEQNTDSEPFTLELLRDAADSIFRDFGRDGHHSKRCVYIKDEQGLTRWCCADDCQIARRSG